MGENSWGADDEYEVEDEDAETWSAREGTVVASTNVQLPDCGFAYPTPVLCIR